MTIVNTLRKRARIEGIMEDLYKEAAFESEAGKAFLYTLGGGLASAGVAYGIPAAIEGVRGARIRANKDKLVAKMRTAHPDLKNYSKRDVDLVYNSLAMHSPKVLKDPLVGGQVMLEALRRGNHMDLGQLSNVSRMTGGTGISDHEREAANIFAKQVGSGASDYAKRYYDAKTDTRAKDQRKLERLKGRIKSRGEIAGEIRRLDADIAQKNDAYLRMPSRKDKQRARKRKARKELNALRAKRRSYN